MQPSEEWKARKIVGQEEMKRRRYKDALEAVEAVSSEGD